MQNFMSVAQNLWLRRSGHTDIHTYRQRSETGETPGKLKYVAELGTGQYTVQVFEIVQLNMVISTGLYRLVEKYRFPPQRFNIK